MAGRSIPTTAVRGRVQTANVIIGFVLAGCILSFTSCDPSDQRRFLRGDNISRLETKLRTAGTPARYQNDICIIQPPLAPLGQGLVIKADGPLTQDSLETLRTAVETFFAENAIDAYKFVQVVPAFGSGKPEILHLTCRPRIEVVDTATAKDATAAASDTKGEVPADTVGNSSVAVAAKVASSPPRNSTGENRAYREGIFDLTLSSKWTRLPQEFLHDLKRGAVNAARELAEASKSADPKDVTAPVAAGFKLQDGSTRILLILSYQPSPTPVDREEMYRTNHDRVRWGIDTGRLKATSKGVSRTTIDSIPSLLVDIETENGARLQDYSLFVAAHPRGVHQLSFMSDTATFNRHSNELACILESIKIVQHPTK